MPDKILPLSAFYDPSKMMSMAMQAGRLENQEHSQALQEERLLQMQAKAGMEQRLAGIKEALPSMPNSPEKAQALTWALNAGAGPNDPRITVTTEALQADGNLLQTMLLAEDADSRTQAFGEYLKRNPKDLKVVQDSHNKQQALVGYGQFLEAAGLPNNDSTRAAVADSGAMQNQLGQAAMESPMEMARREEIQAKTKANQLQIAGMNVGAKVLVEGLAPVAPVIELGEKYLPKMEALTKAGESGLAYQGGRIARAGDPQFGSYLDGMKERRTQAFDDIGKIYEATGNLQRMKNLHTEAGEPLPRGETMESINAKLQSYTMLKDLRDAEVQYYGNPNATTLKAVKEARDAANGQIKNWNGTKKTLDDERIGLTKAAQNLQQKKFETKQGYDSNVALGQSELLDVKAAGGNLDQAAASIARKYKVKPSDIKSALEDPSNRGKMNVILPSPGERDRLAEERTMSQHMDDLLGGFKPEYVGTIDSRVTEGGQVLDTLSPERQAWVQKLRMTANILRHSQFGATLTGYELESAIADLPNEKMGDKQFVAAGKAWKEHWGVLIDERMKALKPIGSQPGGTAPSKPSKPTTAEDYLKSLRRGGG